VSSLSAAFGDLVTDADRAPIEHALAELLDRSRRAWPGLGIAPDDFARHVAERVGGESDPASAIARLHEDLYLACGCARHDPVALASFDREVLSSVDPVLRRFDSSPSYADEIRHQTRIRLLVAEPGRPCRIAGYQGRGSLRSWVQVAAVRLAIESCRGARPDEQDNESALLEAADLGADPELACVKHLYKDEFATAFREAMAALTSRERNVLRMSHLDGLSIDEIGAVYHVHRSTAARWIARAQETLLTATRKSLVDRLRISETEFDSLMLLVQSHLDLSLHRCLATRS